MTALVQPLFAPAAVSSTPFHFRSSTTMMITRTLEVRRVHNSHRELRLSIDVPGAQKDNLTVYLQQSCHPVIQIQGVLIGESFSKTLELPSTTSNGGAALDLNQLHAVLSNGVLDIVAPKLPSSSSSTSSKVNSKSLAPRKKIPVL